MALRRSAPINPSSDAPLALLEVVVVEFHIPHAKRLLGLPDRIEGRLHVRERGRMLAQRRLVACLSCISSRVTRTDS